MLDEWRIKRKAKRLGRKLSDEIYYDHFHALRLKKGQTLRLERPRIVPAQWIAKGGLTEVHSFSMETLRPQIDSASFHVEVSEEEMDRQFWKNLRLSSSKALSKLLNEREMALVREAAGNNRYSEDALVFMRRGEMRAWREPDAKYWHLQFDLPFGMILLPSDKTEPPFKVVIEQSRKGR